MTRSSLLLAVILAVGVGGCGALPARFEVGGQYAIDDLSLHCGYSGVSYLKLCSEWWQFSEGGSGDSIFVSGVLRRVSADTAVLVVDGVSHPLVRVAGYGDAICI